MALDDGLLPHPAPRPVPSRDGSDHEDQSARQQLGVIQNEQVENGIHEYDGVEFSGRPASVQELLMGATAINGGPAMAWIRIMRVSASAMSALCLWSAMDSRVRASAQVPIRIHVVDYPRPVAAAVQQIEKHFG